jgi:hypothetical protein
MLSFMQKRSLRVLAFIFHNQKVFLLSTHVWRYVCDMDSSEHNIKHYVTMTVSDRQNGQVAIETEHSDELPQDSELAMVAATLHDELASAVILADLAYDTDVQGMAMIILEAEGEDSTNLEIVLNPHVDIGEGNLSTAQALTFSALHRLQETLQGHMTLTDFSKEEE